MTIDAEPLGTVTQFNGVGISKNRHYVKISNATYIHKIFEDKHWHISKSYAKPLPIHDYSSYNKQIENAVPLQPNKLLPQKVNFVSHIDMVLVNLYKQ